MLGVTSAALGGRFHVYLPHHTLFLRGLHGYGLTCPFALDVGVDDGEQVGLVVLGVGGDDGADSGQL